MPNLEPLEFMAGELEKGRKKLFLRGREGKIEGSLFDSVGVFGKGAFFAFKRCSKTGLSISPLMQSLLQQARESRGSGFSLSISSDFAATFSHTQVERLSMHLDEGRENDNRMGGPPASVGSFHRSGLIPTRPTAQSKQRL